jgi:hypothetical protein
MVSTNLTVKKILDSEAEYDHALEIRSIGPAIVLVLERDGPLRMELSHSTRSEFRVLLDEVANNPRWAELLDLFDGLRCEDEGIPTADLWQRQDDHVSRLHQGSRIETMRATE